MEYALVMALFVVASMGAIQVLSKEAKEESANQAACVSKRPPPPECIRPAVPPPPTASSSSSTTSSTSTSVPSSSSTTAPPTPVVVSWSATGVADPPTWSATVPASIVDTNGLPLEGAVIEVTVKITEPATTVPEQVLRCTTDASGTCDLTWTAPAPDVAKIQFHWRQVRSTERITYSAPPDLELSSPLGP